MSKLQISDCRGCTDDFYNGNNDLGVQRCWHARDAKMVKRVAIHVHRVPPYKNLKPETRPDFYRVKDFVFTSPDKIGRDGYWKMR